MRNIPFFSSTFTAALSYLGWAAALVWIIAEPRALTFLNIIGWSLAVLSTYNLRFLLDWLQERYQLGWTED